MEDEMAILTVLTRYLVGAEGRHAGEFPCPVCKTGTIRWVRVAI